MIIKGKEIYLREIRISDINRNYCSWLNDPDVNSFLESRFEKWPLEKLRNYVRKIKRNPDYKFLAIVTNENHKHIGNIKLGPVNCKHKFADVGIIIGEKSSWGRGYATQAIRMIVRYAFNELRLHKITAGAYANNVGSIKAFKKAGFSVEGLIAKQYLYKGKYVAGILLGIIRK